MANVLESVLGQTEVVQFSTGVMHSQGLFVACMAIEICSTAHYLHGEVRRNEVDGCLNVLCRLRSFSWAQ